jgi:hypothetical protein
MKSLIALSAALLMSFTVPAFAASNPDPVNINHRHDMMTKKKKNKKHNKKKGMSRSRKEHACPGVQ